METFRKNKTETADEKPVSFVGRSTAEHSPSAILAGVVLHAIKQLKKQIKPAAFQHMDKVVAIALQCDLTGTDTEIKNGMVKAGLSIAEVEDLWAVSKKSFLAARKKQKDRFYQMSNEDAECKAFFAAQDDLVGFFKED